MSDTRINRPKPKVLAWLETASESFLFGSRWFLAPIYLGLVITLVIILIKFFQGLWDLVVHALEDSPHEIVLGLLGLLDLALIGNLILIVIFAGYETFVSKIGVAKNSEDRPHWMGHVDFSGLKIKLVGSLVAISIIELLQDFMRVGEAGVLDAEELAAFQATELWRIGLHLTFVVSGVLFAVMDYIADKRKIMLDEHEHEAGLRKRALAAEHL